MMLADFGTGQVFLSMMYFFLFFIWFWLLIVVFGDIFRSRDLGGLASTLWKPPRRRTPRSARMSRASWARPRAQPRSWVDWPS